MSEVSQEACVRCGDFHSPTDFAIAHIPYCQTCVDRAPISKAKVWLYPPRYVMFQRLAFGLRWSLLITLPLLVLLGFLAVIPGMSPVEFLLLLVIVGLVLGVLIMVATLFIRFSYVQHLGHDRWKADLIDEFGLTERLAGGGFEAHFAIIVSCRPKLTNLKLPMEMGILLVSEAGFVFLGAQDRIETITLSSVKSLGMERMVMWPPRTALRLDLEKGPLFIAFLDEPDFGRNRKKAEELEKLLSKTLAAQSAPPLETH